MRPTIIFATIVALGGATRAEPARDAATFPRGLAVGAELGDPSSATLRFAPGSGRTGIVAAAGTGTFGGLGLSMRVEVTRAMTVLARGSSWSAPLHLGLGVRHHRHHYAPASMDELPDAHTGILAGATMSIVLRRLELYVEAAPGYDVWRTRSCSLASGASSVCPHAQSASFFVEAFAGARWYLGAP